MASARRLSGSRRCRRPAELRRATGLETQDGRPGTRGSSISTGVISTDGIWWSTPCTGLGRACAHPLTERSVFVRWSPAGVEAPMRAPHRANRCADVPIQSTRLNARSCARSGALERCRPVASTKPAAWVRLPGMIGGKHRTSRGRSVVVSTPVTFLWLGLRPWGVICLLLGGLVALGLS